ncbi:MAG: OmpA family protein [Candidatus Krumholzibacteriota bacterium]|nr:OmpA family protein [Candidatus Krumholzibacteriota bacterium]
MRAVILVILAAILLPIGAVPAAGQDAWDGTSGLLRVYDAETIGKGKLIFSLGTCYYRRADVLLTPGPRSLYYLAEPGSEPEVTYSFFSTRAVLTLGISDYLEISAGLGVRNWIMQVGSESESGELETRTRGGIGDTDVQLKLIPPIPSEIVRVGFLGSARFPTGNAERAFTTDNIDFGMKGLFTFDLTNQDRFVPTRLHFNAGYRFNKNEEDGYGILYTNNPDSSGFYYPAYPAVPEDESDSFNDMFEFGTGVEFIVGQASLFLEFKWDQFINADWPEGDTLSYYGNRNKNVYTITPGLSVTSSNGVGVLLALDINLNSDDDPALSYPPDWAAYFAFSYGGFVMAQDADGDGIEDGEDRCPDSPEDFDGFEDDDGCPELDNDGDGINDGVDACPDLAEDFDGFEDEDGCPDLDNDGDGIPDVEDRCPGEPEDFDGIDDADGCPDVMQDTDNDGIPDDMDKCPLKAEDQDGFQDEDGCPDLDNDIDGILDVDDQCPNEPETFNGYEDTDGCPDERPIEAKFILRGINFESGSSALTPDSYGVLDQVVKSLMAYPEVRVEIRGYTDSVGSEESNQRLSEKRANAVRQYLSNAGIAVDRVIAKGYGEADPIAPNTTAAGRAENRRIEFHRLN